MTDFRPGFRLSERDVGVLLVGFLFSALLARFYEGLALAAFFALAHFFLFCNVLRMSRPLELLWAVLFLIAAGSTLRIGFPRLGYTFAAMLAVTLVLAVVEMLRPSYHGVFWQKLNPNLPQWWEANRNGEA